jgi:spermidine/putrescine transport system substrate-binding protein
MNARKISFFIAVILFAILMAGCGGHVDEVTSDVTEPLVVEESQPTEEVVPTPTAKPSGELHILTWAPQPPQEIIDAFELETGIHVIKDTFDSNEALLAKLEAGAVGYDIVNPSQYAVTLLINGGFLEPLDKTMIPNYVNIMKAFEGMVYDPGLVYSIPHIWGTTGFVYNDTCVTEPITSWTAMWDEKYAGRIYMLDNMLAAYIAGLQINGYHAGTTNPDEIAVATQSLIEQKALLGGYDSKTYTQLVAAGDACIAQAWSGSAIKMAYENPHVHYVLPDEGGSMWVDSFAILESAPNKPAAYAFLDYLLRPDVAAKITELLGAPTPNEAAMDLIDPALAALFPTGDQLTTTDMIMDVSSAMQYYQDGWTQIKTAP